MEPYLLHIETSTKNCSIALSRGELFISQAEDRSGDHTIVINGLIRQVMESAGLRLNDVSAIAVNEGPGSYTALRIGVVSAMGICFALDKPLIQLPGLKIIASQAKALKPDCEYYLALIDARRDEVYLAVYANDLTELHSPISVNLNNSLKKQLNLGESSYAMAGDGALKWKNFITNWEPDLVEFSISAGNMIALATAYYKASKFTEIASAKPFYLKPPNITLPRKRLITN